MKNLKFKDEKKEAVLEDLKLEFYSIRITANSEKEYNEKLLKVIYDFKLSEYSETINRRKYSVIYKKSNIIKNLSDKITADIQFTSSEINIDTNSYEQR